jgi:hypothetical protein
LWTGFYDEFGPFEKYSQGSHNDLVSVGRLSTRGKWMKNNGKSQELKGKICDGGDRGRENLLKFMA